MKYPVYEHEIDKIELPGGRRIRDISLESLKSGDLDGSSLKIDEGVLQAQAQIAEESGFPQLAGNLRRAAEMTRFPDDEILEIYEALRPGRSSVEDLVKLASKVEETYGAPLTTAFLREAAGVLRTML